MISLYVKFHNRSSEKSFTGVCPDRHRTIPHPQTPFAHDPINILLLCVQKYFQNDLFHSDIPSKILDAYIFQIMEATCLAQLILLDFIAIIIIINL
jgi:hypothetical protein